MDNSVFISYRRDASGKLAPKLYQYLIANGFRNNQVFYDTESLGTEYIEPPILRRILLHQISARPYFVFILSPGTLERCCNPGDWVYSELEHAITEERKIIIFKTLAFKDDDIIKYLPDDIVKKLNRCQTLNNPEGFSQTALENLRTFLTPIELNLVPVPQIDITLVHYIEGLIAAEPEVTSHQLISHEYFEQASIHSEANDWDAAITDYTKAINLNPQFAYAFNNRANARAENKDFDGAIKDYTEVIRLDPKYTIRASAYCNRGFAYHEKGDFDAAIEDYDVAIRIDPKNAIFHWKLGNTRLRKSDPDAAINQYTKAIELDPQLTEAYKNRAIVYTQKGYPKLAITDYTKAIDINPQFTDAYVNRGNIRNKQDDIPGACEDYAQALKLAPNDPQAKLMREYINANCK